LQYLCNRFTNFDEIWHGNAYQRFTPRQPLKFLEARNTRQRSADILKIAIYQQPSPDFVDIFVVTHTDPPDPISS